MTTFHTPEVLSLLCYGCAASIMLSVGLRLAPSLQNRPFWPDIHQGMARIFMFYLAAAIAWTYQAPPLLEMALLGLIAASWIYRQSRIATLPAVIFQKLPIRAAYILGQGAACLTLLAATTILLHMKTPLALLALAILWYLPPVTVLWLNRRNRKNLVAALMLAHGLFLLPAGLERIAYSEKFRSWTKPPLILQKT